MDISYPGDTPTIAKRKKNPPVPKHRQKSVSYPKTLARGATSHVDLVRVRSTCSSSFPFGIAIHHAEIFVKNFQVFYRRFIDCTSPFFTSKLLIDFIDPTDLLFVQLLELCFELYHLLGDNGRFHPNTCSHGQC